MEKYLDKLKEYTQKLHVCGERNSYSKTDHDATFMRMKEDAMGNGQLKAGYNVQHRVDSEYITWISISPQPTDTTTLIPFLKAAEDNLSFKYEKIVADGGYESEENYRYLMENDQAAFIKPANYEKSKTRKYKTDIGRAENMKYDETLDTYICKDGRQLTVSSVKIKKPQSGYERKTILYSCDDYRECPHKKECIKGNNSKKPLEERNKHLQVSKKFNAYRKESLERILSEEGCELRMNRAFRQKGHLEN